MMKEGQEMQHRIRFRDENWETLETIDIEAATSDLALAHMLCWHNEMIDLYWPKQTSASDLTKEECRIKGAV